MEQMLYPQSHPRPGYVFLILKLLTVKNLCAEKLAFKIHTALKHATKYHLICLFLCLLFVGTICQLVRIKVTHYYFARFNL